LLQGGHKQTNSDTETACGVGTQRAAAPGSLRSTPSTRVKLDVPAGLSPRRLPPQIRTRAYPSSGSTDPNGRPAQAPRQRARPRTRPDRARGDRPPGHESRAPNPTGSPRNQHTSADAATNPIRAPRPRRWRREGGRAEGSLRVEREGPLDDVDGVAVLGAHAAVGAPSHCLVDLHPPSLPAAPARREAARSGSEAVEEWWEACGLG